MQAQRSDAVDLKDNIAQCTLRSLARIIGGNDDWQTEQSKVLQNIKKSIAFPNKDPDDVDGTPHDIEVRVCLALYHGWKRRHGKSFQVVSDFGLGRTISSPSQLARLLCTHMEDFLRESHISNDVQCAASGVICIVTNPRSQTLREAGKLPCPMCTKWCKGAKGLWWHQQQAHKVGHADAAAVAAATVDELAIVLYDPARSVPSPPSKPIGSVAATKKSQQEEAFDMIRSNNVRALEALVQSGSFDPVNEKDRNGAYAIHWAAGSGSLEMLKYLVEDCACPSEQPQRGKRSFLGRTPLHWSARNGHLAIVEYLVVEQRVNLESVTVDGTSAFCWAAWQGHLKIMKLLCSHNCNIHSSNKFGCNSVLWCAQGNGGVECLQWLHSCKVDVTVTNNNGHSALHKAAQRGHPDICVWFVDEIAGNLPVDRALNLVGPDLEDHCPSDLAGVEGWQTVARYLAEVEIKLAQNIRQMTTDVKWQIPSWLSKPVTYPDIDTFRSNKFLWEPCAGLNRMRLEFA